MSESDDKSQPPVPLNVLSNSGKLEQLRREPQGSPMQPADASLVSRFVDQTKTPAQKAVLEKAIDGIRQIYDPEIPVNIYELGLIYGIEVDPQTLAVQIRMTLTAPGCPVAGSLVAEVQQCVEAIDEVPSAKVELVWDPPWSKDRMSEAALLELGLI